MAVPPKGKIGTVRAGSGPVWSNAQRQRESRAKAARAQTNASVRSGSRALRGQRMLLGPIARLASRPNTKVGGKKFCVDAKFFTIHVGRGGQLEITLRRAPRCTAARGLARRAQDAKTVKGRRGCLLRLFVRP